MTVKAVMRDGAEVELSSRYGASVQDVADALTEETLTGSAVTLSEVEVETADGGTVLYEDINSLVDEHTLF